MLIYITLPLFYYSWQNFMVLFLFHLFENYFSIAKLDYNHLGLVSNEIFYVMKYISPLKYFWKVKYQGIWNNSRLPTTRKLLFITFFDVISLLEIGMMNDRSFWRQVRWSFPIASTFWDNIFISAYPPRPTPLSISTTSCSPAARRISAIICFIKT